MRTVRLKECVWQRHGDDLTVMFDPAQTVRIKDAERQVERLLAALRKAPAREDQLQVDLRAHGMTVGAEDLGRALHALDRLGLIENGAELALGDPAQDERHASNLAFFSSFADRWQGRAAFVRRIRAAHVLQLGVGGMGSSVVQCLAGLGVGRLTLVDDDDVAPSNLARQFLYRTADIGRAKVIRAAAWVRAFDPSIEVHAVSRRITAAPDVADLLDGVDLVVSSIDEPQDVHLGVNAAAVGRSVPLVLGGVGPYHGTYSSVDPGRSACRACVVRAMGAGVGADRAALERALVERLDRPNGSTAPMVTLVGGLIALEAVRYLTGVQPPQAAGARIAFDLRDGLIHRREEFRRDPDCAVCGAVEPRPASPR